MAVLALSALAAIPGCGKMSPKGESVSQAPSPAAGAVAEPSALAGAMTVDAPASVGSAAAGAGLTTLTPGANGTTADAVAANRDAFLAFLKSATPSA